MTRLKEIHEDLNYTQKEIADILEIQQTHYSKYELGKNEMPLYRWIKIALFFNISLDYLCGISETPRTLTGIDYFENRRIILRNKRAGN